MRGHDKTERGRGWGPFTGRQLTTIVCVAIVAMVLIPTAAIAAAGSFTSGSNATPAVRAINTASNGIGVAGNGKHYGVFSNGPLGVATGNALSCSACVTPADLSLLPSGTSESGMYAAGGGQDAATDYLMTGITYVHPLATAILDTHVIDTDTGANPLCPRPGAAARGYLCLYPVNGPGSDHNVLHGYGYSSGTGELFSRPSVGMDILWQVTGTGPYVWGEYTVTAP